MHVHIKDIVMTKQCKKNQIYFIQSLAVYLMQLVSKVNPKRTLMSRTYHMCLM